MDKLIEAANLDDLLREIETTPAIAAPEPTIEITKTAKTTGINSTSFSTYGKVRGACADMKEDVTINDEECTLLKSGLNVPKRVLPRSLEPLGRPDAFTSDNPTPWDTTRLETLPGLKKTPQTSPSKADESMKTAAANRQSITPKTEVTIRCIRVGKQSSVVPMPRWGHCTGFIPSTNSLLIFGGMRHGSTWEASNDMHEFSLDTQGWEPSFYAKGSPPSARYSAAGAAVSDSFFVIGGLCTTGALYSDIHEYNCDTQEWFSHDTSKATKFTARGEHSATIWNKKIIIFGGRISKDAKTKKETDEPRKRIAYENDLWIFDTKSKKLKQIHPTNNNPIPARRSGHSSCVVNDILYIHGGLNMSQDFSDLWSISLSDSNLTWIQIHVPVESLPRNGHLMISISSHLFLYGGIREPNSSSGLIEFIDPTAVEPHWVCCGHSGALATAFTSYQGSGCLKNGVLYTFGGRVLPGNTASADVLSMLLCTDILIDKFTVKNGMLRSFKKIQILSPQPWNTIRLTVGGSGRILHKSLIQDCYPNFWDHLKQLLDGDCCILDGNKRRKGIPCISSSDILHQLCIFLYSGHFDEVYLQEMQTVAVELKLESLGDYISAAHTSRVSVGIGRKVPMMASCSPKGLKQLKNPTITSLYSDRMYTLRTQGSHHDVYIRNDVADSQVVKCHSAVLAAASPILRKVFRTVGKGKTTLNGIKVQLLSTELMEITVADLSSNAIEAAVIFMYEGNCAVDLNNAAGVMQAASLFKLPLLIATCEKEIWSQMSGETPDQICSLLATAERYTAHQLREKCMATLAGLAPEQISELNTFGQLPEQLQKELLLQSNESRFSVTNRTQQSQASYQQRHDAAHSRGFL